MSKIKTTKSVLPVVSCVMAQPFLSKALEQGISVEPFLAKTGLSYDDIRRGEAFMIGQLWYDLLDDLAKAIGNPHFGFEIGAFAAVDTLPNMRVLNFDGATLGELLTSLVVDVARLSSMATYELKTNGTTAELNSLRTFEPTSLPRQAEGYYAGFMMSLCRACCKDEWQPKEFKITICDPKTVPNTYRNQMTVKRGNRMGAKFEFPAAWLLLGLRSVKGQKLPDAERADAFLSQLDRLIDLYLDQQDVSLERFCKLTSLSPSKLRRALSKEGTSLHRRIDERRKIRAQALLLNSDLELPQVGSLVGFPEPASFSRTFKRWTGIPPGKFRQNSKN